ncbi:MAG: hypothetical protein ABUR63_07790 [Verrucomicrobiota bacterium]
MTAAVVVGFACGGSACSRGVVPGDGDGGPTAPAATGGGAPRAGTWSVDPHQPGPDLPPSGRSLFDFVVAGGAAVPFPLPALSRLIAQRAYGVAAPGLLKRVLIPRGRSLQRNAAGTRPFAFPRAILAVDGQPAPARHPRRAPLPLLDGRLYVAYQETAAELEVVSYNEAAGRFEFQIVRDYAPGRRPVVTYARRAVCTSCHQNAAAIFSRPLWDETAANPRVAAALGASGGDAVAAHGVPVRQGVDVAYQIDDATDRANRLGAFQRVWREGCGADDAAGARCRARLLALVLRYRLSDTGALPANAALPDVAWSRLWPVGMVLPNPDIPNRDPFAGQQRMDVRTNPVASPSMPLAALAALLASGEIPGALDPLAQRGPGERWPLVAARGADLERVVAGLAGFLADEDVRLLDAALASRASRVSPPCAPATASGVACFRMACTAAEQDVDGEPGVRSIDVACGDDDPGAAGGHAADTAGQRVTAAPLSLAGRIYLGPRGIVRGRGEVDGIAFDGTRALRNLAIAGGAVVHAGGGGTLKVSVDLVSRTLGARARTADGRVLSALRLDLARGDTRGESSREPSVRRMRGQASLAVGGDDAVLEGILAAFAGAPAGSAAADAVSAAPFRRARVMEAVEAALSLPARTWCCLDARAMPPPVLSDPVPVAPESSPRQTGTQTAPKPKAKADEASFAAVDALLRRHCGACHDTRDRTPPNFLHGPPARRAANAERCAERILFRLSMWDVSADARQRTPMPPPSALARMDATRPGGQPAGSRYPELASLRGQIGALLDRADVRLGQRAAITASPYDNLRPCLAE